MLIYLGLYNFLLLVSLILSLPFIWKKIRPDSEFSTGLKERLGIYDRETVEKLKRQKNIWIHTVSIGEFLSITPLIEHLRCENKNNIVVTFATKTGRGVAEKKIDSITYLFFPIDIYPVMRNAIRKINTKLIVIVETELWPNLLYIANRQNIPVVLINGRVSPFSYPKYKKFRFFARKVLPLFSAITMRSEEEAEKMIYLGADKNKVKVVGSMKFDLAYEMSKTVHPEKVREILGIEKDRRVVVFGSLHTAEERPIIEVAEKLLKKFQDILVVIVPRYLDKTNVYNLLKNRGMYYTRRSEIPCNKKCSVIVVDTYGELNNFYAISEIAFVGGSLYRWGGQNPIEPLAFKKPVLYGPYHWHFKEEWQKIREGGGGIEVSDYEHLYNESVRLLENPEECKRLGEQGYHTLLKNIGATERNLKILLCFTGN
ncbi:MAG: glycosyltransferase N-terminal domain-containing protein [Candidatus Ratteibacteria bacterium]|nr:glycosyltransferase N-terminal domain-containing protein [Candidatus Ratteibacteria bacterium]